MQKPSVPAARLTHRPPTLHYHEALLQAARQRQKTDEFKDTYRLRAAVERKIAELTDAAGVVPSKRGVFQQTPRRD